MNRRRSQAGFTVIEVAISGTILGVIVLLAVEVSRSTIDSTYSSVLRSEQTQRVSRSLDGLSVPLAAAGKSSLIATPYGGGSVPEPMQDGAVYDNLSFQKATGFADGQVVYDGTGPGGPHQITYVPWDPQQPTTTGVVTYFNGQRTQVLHKKVTAFQVMKQGPQLIFTVTPYSKQGALPPLTHKVLLRAF